MSNLWLMLMIAALCALASGLSAQKAAPEKQQDKVPDKAVDPAAAANSKEGKTDTKQNNGASGGKSDSENPQHSMNAQIDQKLLQRVRNGAHASSLIKPSKLNVATIKEHAPIFGLRNIFVVLPSQTIHRAVEINVTSQFIPLCTDESVHVEVRFFFHKAYATALGFLHLDGTISNDIQESNTCRLVKKYTLNKFMLLVEYRGVVTYLSVDQVKRHVLTEMLAEWNFRDFFLYLIDCLDEESGDILKWKLYTNMMGTGILIFIIWRISKGGFTASTIVKRVFRDYRMPHNLNHAQQPAAVISVETVVEVPAVTIAEQHTIQGGAPKRANTQQRNNSANEQALAARFPQNGHLAIEEDHTHDLRNRR